MEEFVIPILIDNKELLSNCKGPYQNYMLNIAIVLFVTKTRKANLKQNKK